MQELSPLLVNMETYLESKGRTLVIQAAHFAEQCHEGFFRQDGSSYLLHPIAVATILSEWHAPPEVLAAALLHDVLKKSCSHLSSLKDLEAAFPSPLVSLVRDVASLGSFGLSLLQKEVDAEGEMTYVEQEEAELVQAYVEEALTSTRNKSHRFWWAAVLLQRNPIAVVIKLADRLHNLQTHDALPIAIRQETDKWFAAAIFNIFAPLAYRLGMQRVREQLEDGAFALYKPDQYNATASLRRVLESMSLDDRIHHLKTILQRSRIEAEIQWKPRHLYALFRRQLARAMRDLVPADMLSLTVVVPSIEDCYRALGVVHSAWRPLGQVYDNIANPGPNGYRALRTRIFDDELGSITVIISTKAMHLAAELGITAQWREGIAEELLPRFDPLPPRPEGYIMAINPKGEIRYLPEGANSIDFAYALHEEIGHHCMQTLVNGNQIPLEMPLEDGAVVDIIVSRGAAGPGREWLHHVKTKTARDAIENWVRSYKYVELIVQGTERVGLLRDVLECISSKEINIIYSHSEVVVDKASFHIVLDPISQVALDELQKELQSRHQIKLQIKTSESMPQIPLYTSSHKATSSSPLATGTLSPYALAPVKGRNFKGRDREVREIEDRLRGKEHDNPLLIWGQQRIGKTSLLMHLEQDVLPEQYLIINVTLHDVLHQPLGYFLHHIALQIEQKAHRSDVQAPDPGIIRQDPMFQFQNFMDHLTHVVNPQKLLIILDEFQGIATLQEENATRQDVFTYFRSLLQREFAVNFLFCGGGVPEHLLEQSGLGSLLSVVDSIKVDVLDQRSAIELIVDIEGLAQPTLHYEEKAIQRMLAITDCHPCYLKYLCRELYRRRTSQHISFEDVEQVIMQTMEWKPKIEALIKHFWEMNSQNSEQVKQNKRILAAIASRADSSRWTSFNKIAERVYPFITEEELPTLLADLTGYGSIDANTSYYRIHLPLLELWFQSV